MADQEVPEEIQDYYQTERRERTGVAWLLALGTLIVTILLAGGIFFGGRSLYRRFNDGNKQPEVAQNDQGEQERPTESNNEQSQEQKSNPPAENNGQGNAVQGDESSNNTNPAPSPSPTPATGDASGDLPGTGPGSTISIFFAVSTLGYIIHRFYVKAN